MLNAHACDIQARENFHLKARYVRGKKIYKYTSTSNILIEVDGERGWHVLSLSLYNHYVFSLDFGNTCINRRSTLHPHGYVSCMYLFISAQFSRLSLSLSLPHMFISKSVHSWLARVVQVFATYITDRVVPSLIVQVLFMYLIVGGL